MWLTIAERSVLPLRPCAQGGCWECHASVWPRTRIPRPCAWLTIRSALAKLKEPRDGSVASHFISFSGVAALNSRLRIVTYVESLSLLAATAAPKYRPPFAAAEAPSVVAAKAGVASIAAV